MTPAQLEALGNEIATFAARIDVAEHALITRLRTFDAHEAWGPTGFLSCAAWLSWRIGIGIKAAREKVRVARALRPRTLGSGYELVVITTPEQLENGSGGVGGFLPDGTPVPLHVARMLAGDGSRVDVVMGKDGELLDVGRRTRTIPSAIARGLWLRDGGCRVPGCGRKRHLHAHHIQGWAEGGPTRLSNLVLVCSGHHRMIHEGKLSSAIREGRIVFADQKGRYIPGVPSSAASGHDLEELELFLREAELHLDPSINLSKWDGSHVEVGEMLDWMLMAEQPKRPPDTRLEH